MCHQWSKQAAALNAVDSLRHGKVSNYLFVDGHVESLRLEQTFDPAAGINLWNPSLAK
jgi:prepilin-type processing-associated H-X9-DG protein